MSIGGGETGRWNGVRRIGIYGGGGGYVGGYGLQIVL